MLLRGTVLDQDNMVIDAAVDGQGAALARTALAARDFARGTAGAAIAAGAGGAVRLLDRVFQGGGGAAEGRDIPRLAAGRGGTGSGWAAAADPVRVRPAGVACQARPCRRTTVSAGTPPGFPRSGWLSRTPIPRRKTPA